MFSQKISIWFFEKGFGDAYANKTTRVINPIP